MLDDGRPLCRSCGTILQNWPESVPATNAECRDCLGVVPDDAGSPMARAASFTHGRRL